MTTPHDKALAAFTDYFVRNYPGPDTVIFDPKWHAPKLFNAAMKAIEAAGGIVCAREPIGNIHINSLELLKEGSIAHIYPIATVNDRMRPLHIPIEAGNGGDGSRVRGWFVKDYSDGWIYFDNEEDAKRQVDATGAMMLVGFAPYDPIVKSAAEQFARWLDDGPKLAKAAGCYVGIKVTNLPSPPSPSNEGEKQS